ncbi:MAG: DAK2 domain-containing protein [Anaerolineaceae bacterium]|nr:DAK2 domain-containing protein [Anaerolineaceae bacterium]
MSDTNTHAHFLPLSVDDDDSIINGSNLKALILAGLTWLKTNQQTVNSLNVFPVPDGDTGTNMVLTMQAAYDEIADSSENNIGKLAHAVAQGALMGARGNSGVILSQLWRGFARGLDNLESMDAPTLVKALEEAKITAYKGVVKPVEGTILTVAKDISTSATKTLGKTRSLEAILEAIVTEAAQSVERTPELLPILKQAGVVDSGGKGLYFILDGMLRFIRDMDMETPEAGILSISSMNLENTEEMIEPGQDYEIVLDFSPNSNLDMDTFYTDLGKIGTSIQIGEGDGFYRLHIHVPKENRNRPVEYVESIGTIFSEKTENLMAQMEQRRKQSAEQIAFNTVVDGMIGLIAVSPGDGFDRIFASLDVNAVIKGGQTMNPSTEQILQAAESLPTDRIIVLPNNKNIILAAQTAATVSKKKLAVVPTRSIPQGLAATLRMNPSGDLDTVYSEMCEALGEVETGEITQATRSVKVNDVNVKEGEVIALHNGNLVYSSDNPLDACLGLLSKIDLNSHERITFFWGCDMKSDEVDRIAAKVKEKFPAFEIEIHSGGQPHYQLILSIE